MKLRPLGVEFGEYFQNTSALPDIPNMQDLQCLADLTKWTSSITSGKYWALKMIDSWGSIPSGYLHGSCYDMGNFDECLGINKVITSTHSIKGKYCFMELPIAKYILGVDFSSSNMKIASCFPASCSGQLMDRFLGTMLQRLIGLENANGLVTINENSCQTKDSQPYDGLTIFLIVILSLFALATILATLYDYFLCKNQEQLHHVVKIFSARANSRVVFRIVEPSTNPNVIDCLHGLRCMSLIWVVYSHEYIFSMMAPNLNQYALVWWFEHPFTSFILEGFFSVDTFFFISGLLLAMISLRSMEKLKGKINIPLMYLHRYLRLTPILAIAILVYWKLLPRMVRGPLSDQGFSDYSVCEWNWYKTLLYIQNYASTDLCVPHSWYLAVDMQLYIISPILLIAVYKWGKKAAGGIVILILLLSACLFTTMLLGDLSRQFKNNEHAAEAQQKLYFSTHTHAAPWLIGFLFGYFLHLKRGQKFNLSRPYVWLGWLLCLAMIFTSIFALYPYVKWGKPALSILGEAFYYTLTRIGWPLSLCWVVFACMQGYGGLANSFLSSPLWQPLSRLSYSIYIWHIFVQEINHRRIQTVTFFSDYEVMLQFWSSFGFAVIMSYVMYIAVEAPLGGIESLLMPNKKPKPHSKEEPTEPKDNKPKEGTTDTS
ncbi:nose resistant to fluoxetine protein 6 [Drosophila willistoni]|uniref:nose resistant to fluoxetine protein 6 n=1 Tax=Drosophila willistoni TaxID=7260 RepID=UPI00017D8BA4|nr:nose resistant to fluoxetine protein 6 [Drosophila willistoni]